MQVFDLHKISDGKLWVGLLKIESEGNLNEFVERIGFPQGMTIPQIIEARRALLKWTDDDTLNSFRDVVLYPNEESFIRKLLFEILRDGKKDSLKQLYKHMKDKNPLYDLSEVVIDLANPENYPSGLKDNVFQMMITWASGLKKDL